ncbi:hypothetical protein HU200_050022 [Digitaria exilis]|uniref:WRKY domain-containing protein n=1 Tax=Digitaria exilis TaxID=1010633 RepID=A0A835ASA7_9POAL|nr:hypothetical protein HU200_050022 [Digitaria exilis]
MAFCCVPPEKEADDRERAVQEVAEVYERIKIQQPLLLLHCSSSYQHQHHLAQTLLSEALRALNVALSVMTKQPAAAPPISSVVVKAEPHHQPSSPRSPGRSGSNKKRRRSITAMETASSSWAGLTTVPYDDGYEWRKYGEKKINGTNYTRSYFRCTYKDDTGCLATKYVQQKDSSDPPVFHVTYNNNHTCTNNNAAAAAMVKNTIKQEPQPVVLLPPLIEASALPFDDQTLPCKQQAPPLFPITMPQQLFSARDCHGGGDIPSTSSSSSFSGGESCSCDGNSSPGRGIHMDNNMVQRQMPAAEASAAPADDDLSFYDYDLDLFLLCDSFKDY